MDGVLVGERERPQVQLRTLPAGATARVELQNAPLGGTAFTTVRAFTIRSDRPFLRTVPRFEGRFRLAWTPAGAAAPVHSRAARIAPR